MRIGQIGSRLTQAAILCLCIYGVVKWQASNDESSDVMAFTERACKDAIGARYDVSSIRLYDVKKNSSGYTVRASVTLSRGTPAKVTCLANAHGGIRDVIIDER